MKKKRIIIFFSIGIGDSILCTPAIKSIQKERKNYIIDALFMNKASYDIFKKSSFFDNVYHVDFVKESFVKSLGRVLIIRKNHYQKSFLIFPANLYKYQIIHFLLGAKERYSFNYLKKSHFDFYWLSNKNLTEDRNLHVVEENIKLFSYGLNINIQLENQKMNLPLDDRSRNFAQNFLLEKNIKNRKIIGIHAGSDIFKNMINRRWDKEKFGLLLKKLYEENGYFFLIFGSEKEYVLNDYIHSFLPDNSIVVKDTSFTQSAALIECCNIFITNDSGLMHTASALNTPVIAIIGPTNPNYIHPYNTPHEIVKKNYKCMPCFEYSKEPLTCHEADNFKCIKDISVDDVMESYYKLLLKIDKI